MSVRVSSWVWHAPETAELSGTKMMVLLALADVADDHGLVAFVDDVSGSQDALARKARVSRRTFQRVVSELAQDGLLEVVREGVGAVNRYRIPMRQIGACHASSGGACHASQVAHDSSYNVNNVNNVRNDAKSVVDEAFERAWKAWPKHDRKKPAREKFHRLVKSMDVDWLTGEIERFGVAYASAVEDVRFVPALVVWLNQERWTDDLPSPRDGSGPSEDDWMNL